MNNLVSAILILSAFTWGTGYFYYHEGRFIHIFLGIAIFASLVKIMQERYNLKRRKKKHALVKAIK